MSNPPVSSSEVCFDQYPSLGGYDERIIEYSKKMIVLLKKGYSSEQIAKQLRMALRTVRAQFSLIKQAIGANTMIHIIYLTSPPKDIRSSKLFLTEQDVKILQCLLEGLTGEMAATKLGISYNCIRRHRDKMCGRNFCKSMLELVAMLYREA